MDTDHIDDLRGQRTHIKQMTLTVVYPDLYDGATNADINSSSRFFAPNQKYNSPLLGYDIVPLLPIDPNLTTYWTCSGNNHSRLPRGVELHHPNTYHAPISLYCINTTCLASSENK